MSHAEEALKTFASKTLISDFSLLGKCASFTKFLAIYLCKQKASKDISEKEGDKMMTDDSQNKKTHQQSLIHKATFESNEFGD